MNWANQVTCLRILLIPVVVFCYHSEMVFNQLLAVLLFTLAGLSNWLVEYLARRFNVASEFGAFLDPVADKLLVVTILVMLVGENSLLLLPAVVIIIAREILISALGEWMASKGHRDAVAVAFTGKLKTTLQMIAIIVLMMVSPETPQWLLNLLGTTPSLWLLFLGYGLIAVAALLSFYSAIHYLRVARPYLST